MSLPMRDALLSVFAAEVAHGLYPLAEASLELAQRCIAVWEVDADADAEEDAAARERFRVVQHRALALVSVLREWDGMGFALASLEGCGADFIPGEELSGSAFVAAYGALAAAATAFADEHDFDALWSDVLDWVDDYVFAKHREG